MFYLSYQKCYVISRRFQAYVLERRNFEGWTELFRKPEQSRNSSESKPWHKHDWL